MRRLLFLAAVFFGISCYAQDQNHYAHYLDSMKNSYIGREFPAFEVVTLDGKKINNNTIRGKVVFLNYWYDMCAPCRAEFGGLNALYDSLRGNKDVVFLAITFEPEDKLPAIIMQHDIKYPVASIQRQRLEQIPVLIGYPTNVVLSREGRMVFIKNGGPGNPVVATQKILEELLPIIKAYL